MSTAAGPDERPRVALLEADAPPIVVVDHVGKTYGAGPSAVHAVQDVSFSIRPGELVALVGRSGSGKTTLLNLIGGLDRPDSGTVAVDGR